MMNIQITSVEMKYEEKELSNIQSIFDLDSPTLRYASGKLDLTIEEYRGNESVDQLEIMAARRLIDELQDFLDEKERVPEEDNQDDQEEQE